MLSEQFLCHTGNFQGLDRKPSIVPAFLRQISYGMTHLFNGVVTLTTQTSIEVNCKA